MKLLLGLHLTPSPHRSRLDRGSTPSSTTHDTDTAETRPTLAERRTPKKIYEARPIFQVPPTPPATTEGRVDIDTAFDALEKFTQQFREDKTQYIIKASLSPEKTTLNVDIFYTDDASRPIFSCQLDHNSLQINAIHPIFYPDFKHEFKELYDRGLNIYPAALMNPHYEKVVAFATQFDGMYNIDFFQEGSPTGEPRLAIDIFTEENTIIRAYLENNNLHIWFITPHAKEALVAFFEDYARTEEFSITFSSDDYSQLGLVAAYHLHQTELESPTRLSHIVISDISRKQILFKKLPGQIGSPEHDNADMVLLRKYTQLLDKAAPVRYHGHRNPVFSKANLNYRALVKLEHHKALKPHPFLATLITIMALQNKGKLVDVFSTDNLHLSSILMTHFRSESGKEKPDTYEAPLRFYGTNTERALDIIINGESHDPVRSMREKLFTAESPLTPSTYGESTGADTFCILASRLFGRPDSKDDTLKQLPAAVIVISNNEGARKRSLTTLGFKYDSRMPALERITGEDLEGIGFITPDSEIFATVELPEETAFTGDTSPSDLDEHPYDSDTSSESDPSDDEGDYLTIT